MDGEVDDDDGDGVRMISVWDYWHGIHMRT